MNKSDLIYLDHILDSFLKISQYTEGITFEQFVQDEEKQDAIIRKIEVAGEATKRLSKTLRENYQAIDWRAIAGMRDKLIHDYFEVDLEIVWETAINDIPGLIPKIKDVHKELL